MMAAMFFIAFRPGSMGAGEIGFKEKDVAFFHYLNRNFYSNDGNAKTDRKKSLRV